MSRQAAAEQLRRLREQGLVADDPTRSGVGRPRRLWSLTPAGHARFPDAHAQVSVELIEAVRAEFGAAGLDRLIGRRETASLNAYRAAVPADGPLEARLAALAEARSAEGYMAEWRREADGAYLLVENHCPICAAARACQGFCRSELAQFQALLAPAKVERVEHLLEGARRCAYRVTPD